MMTVLQDAIGRDMCQVDAVIRKALDSKVVLIRQVAEYIVQSGGKRLRPALVVLAARLCGGTDISMSSAYTLAAVIEIIHTTSLLHDDVVDESDMRRGKPTANTEFGNKTSILVGDFLYSRAFQLMVAVDKMAVLKILSDATNQIAEGEVLQLLNMHDPDVDETRYFQVVESKTAALFEASARVGAMAMNATDEQIESLGAYGYNLGMAFQLVDDILDFAGDESKIGKCLGDDLAEGKPTLPLICAMQRANKAGAAMIREAIVSPDRKNMEKIVGLINQTDALAYSKNKAFEYAESAKNAIISFPDSIFKKTLVQLPLFVVERTV